MLWLLMLLLVWYGWNITCELTMLSLGSIGDEQVSLAIVHVCHMCGMLFILRTTTILIDAFATIDFIYLCFIPCEL